MEEEEEGKNGRWKRWWTNVGGRGAYMKCGRILKNMEGVWVFVREARCRVIGVEVSFTLVDLKIFSRVFREDGIQAQLGMHPSSWRKVFIMKAFCQLQVSTCAWQL